MKKTKIVCTVGPASSAKQTIEKMLNAGMNGARINTAYGNLPQYQTTIETVREAADIPIIIDIKGPEIRIRASQRKVIQKGDMTSTTKWRLMTKYTSITEKSEPV